MIRAVGIILVIALLTIPPATAAAFHPQYDRHDGLFDGFKRCFTTGGLVLSYIFDLPSGATIIILCALGYMVEVCWRGARPPKPLAMFPATD